MWSRSIATGMVSMPVTNQRDRPRQAAPAHGISRDVDQHQVQRPCRASPLRPRFASSSGQLLALEAAHPWPLDAHLAGVESTATASRRA